jgi:NADH-quinone oxidoreductase subunit G
VHGRDRDGRQADAETEQPACATPVMEGNEDLHAIAASVVRAAQRDGIPFVSTIRWIVRSAIRGGECELQDLSMGYGRSLSRFAERKTRRADEDLGPLISTEMTRCIQCTRCVRFMTEVAGSPELGGIGRGENLEIGTYIGKAIDSDWAATSSMSARSARLTNKVFRFKARRGN